MLFMIENKIRNWLGPLFAEGDFAETLLIEIVVNNSKVEVFIDDEEGITFRKCQKISRFLEEKIDSSMVLGAKYTLEVSSPGDSRPLQFFPQYKKHVDRRLKVVLNNGDVKEGKLVSAENQRIDLEVVVLVEKKRKKEVIQISFEEIDHSFVIFKF